MTFLPKWKYLAQNLFSNKRCVHHDLVQATMDLNLEIRNCTNDKGNQEKQNSVSYQWEMETGFDVTNSWW